MDDEEHGEDEVLQDAWELFEQGDLDSALEAALNWIETDAGNPDAHNLIGSVLMARGELSQALLQFGAAMEADPHYTDAMLNAADALIRMGDASTALQLAADAVEAAEASDDREMKIDAMLLQVDLLLATGRREEADAIGKELPVGPFEAPEMGFAVGRALFQLGDIERSSALLEEAHALGVEAAEASYYLGLAREARGDRREATAAFLECRDRDLAEGAPLWAEPIPIFERRLRAAIGRLPPELSELLDGALVLVDEVPGAEVVCEGVDPRAPILMDDVDLASESGQDTLRRVFVYQRNVERFVPGPGFLDEELDRLLIDEVPRAFGERPEGLEPFEPAL